MSKKYFLTFHTIFIMDENVQWIEEFLIYYLNLGFDHFYLYDNTGSRGRKSRDGSTTKYNFPIVKQDPDIWRNIYDKYEKYITYIKYHPKNDKGEIVYGINNSALDGIENFINEYKHETEWCYVGDFDEFIFSPNNNKLLDIIRSSNSPIITLHQKIFLHRCLTEKKFITQEFKCINNLSNKSYGGQKNIINLKNINGVTSCHNFTGKKTILPLEEWRFNHYNFCPKRKLKLDKHSIDDSMSRYCNLFYEN